MFIMVYFGVLRQDSSAFESEKNPSRKQFISLQKDSGKMLIEARRYICAPWGKFQVQQNWNTVIL